MDKFLRSLQLFSVIYIAVGLLWELLEVMILGHINPNPIDSIIGLILTMSLYENIRIRIERRK